MSLKKVFKKVIKKKREGTLPTPEDLGFKSFDTPFGVLYFKIWTINEALGNSCKEDMKIIKTLTGKP